MPPTNNAPGPEARPASPHGDVLIVRGARQHNLKDVHVELPRDRLVVVTGPSGSGKSSLAFDTIYAEGQRRYVESLSAYARQFLEQLAKPEVESIDGLSPAIAIEQRALSKSPRSTVGTVTEIADYLRLLFARAGSPHCPSCGKPIEAQTVPQIVDRVMGLPEGAKVTLLAPIARARRGELKLELERLRREGFVRARVDGEIIELGDDIVLDRTKAHDLDVVVDRLVVRDGIKSRATDSVELALKLGEGRLLVAPSHPDLGEDGAPFWMSERFACVECGVSLPPIEPRMFSFNSPHGACPACDGIGTRTRVDEDRIVPDAKKTLRQGAVAAWGRRGSLRLATEVDRAVTALGVDPDVAWSKLPVAVRQAILHGTGPRDGDATTTAAPATGAAPAVGDGGSEPPPSRPAARGRTRRRGDYEGVVPRLERLLESGVDLAADEADEGEEDDDLESDELGRFVVVRTCDVCKGRRLRPEALAVKLGGTNMADIGQMPLAPLRRFLASIVDDAERMFAARERAVALPLLRAVVARLGFLIDVGLDYLSLDRSAQTLSGGEGQRIRLATQIGSALVGVLYVLDEPSVGLHARDNARLLEALRRLVDLGNSAIVVEHDREAIMAADWVVDMGPGAGVHGGRIVSEGTPAQVIADPRSVSGPWLAGQRKLELPGARKAPDGQVISIRNAREHNLRGVDVDFPTGLLVAVTGVSGSGKSSLIVDTLLPAARRDLYRATGVVGACDAIEGLSHVDKVVSIDQAPLGRTPRSNPATYTGVFALLRDLFAGLPEARARGYKAGRFSFNVKGGRCESCQGDGVLRVEMHFLPDVFVECEACGGKRYGRETLEVLYRGMSIADALDLTVDEALQQFDAVPRIRERLTALSRVGLGYLALGQPATTLSGGEAQRVKLARELARRATGRTLYVLDEPTTGLHFADVEQLLLALAALRDQGNTIVIIEHNLDLVACCDWVIDLGPDGGDKGGELVAAGTPEQVAACEASHTGRFLRPILEGLARKPTSTKKAAAKPADAKPAKAAAKKAKK